MADRVAQVAQGMPVQNGQQLVQAAAQAAQAAADATQAAAALAAREVSMDQAVQVVVVVDAVQVRRS